MEVFFGVFNTFDTSRHDDEITPVWSLSALSIIIFVLPVGYALCQGSVFFHGR